MYQKSVNHSSYSQVASAEKTEAGGGPPSQTGAPTVTDADNPAPVPAPGTPAPAPAAPATTAAWAAALTVPNLTSPADKVENALAQSTVVFALLSFGYRKDFEISRTSHALARILFDILSRRSIPLYNVSFSHFPILLALLDVVSMQ